MVLTTVVTSGFFNMDDPSSYIFIFIIGFSIFSYLFEAWIDWRQNRCLHPSLKLPDALKSVVTDEVFKKAQAYSRAKSLFAFKADFFDALLNLAFLFNVRRVWLWPAIAFEDELVHALAFVATLVWASMLLHVPIAAYRTFVIEERFGFNKTTLRTFVLDYAKSLALQVVLGGPLLYGFLRIIAYAGDGQFWPALWAFMFAVMLFMLVVYPTFIQPCFNTFKELEADALRADIEALAKRVDFPLSKIMLMDASTRTAHSNAYFYGLPCMMKRVVLFDTLLKCETDETLAILGHEFGHYRLNHMLYNLVVVQLNLGATLFLFNQSISYAPLYDAFGFADARPPIIGLLLFSLLYSPIDMVLSLAMHSLSRRFEYQADRFAARLGMADALGRALIAISAQNLTTYIVDPLYSLVHHTHPTLLERLQELKKKNG